MNAPAEDALLREIRAIVGDEWATNDRGDRRRPIPTIPCPVAAPRMPAYVVLPGTRDEVVRASSGCSTTRGSLGRSAETARSVMGLVMSEGAVIDLGRMKDIAFDEKNWLVRVGAGVSAFDAAERSRSGAATGSTSPSRPLWYAPTSSARASFRRSWPRYGTAADNFVDAEFVARDGSVFRSHEKSAPNLFAFRRRRGVSGDLHLGRA